MVEPPYSPPPQPLPGLNLKARNGKKVQLIHCNRRWFIRLNYIANFCLRERERKGGRDSWRDGAPMQYRELPVLGQLKLGMG